MLSVDAFAGFDVEELFRRFRGRSGLLIAVSGGPDSMALLRLAARWRSQGGTPPVFAATVDHGLRPDSAAEALAVAGWAEAIGVPHAILAWEGDKPATRIQERAREARYALLASHAGAVDADTILAAHHADDQAETILHRLARGSGVRGLAGMAAETRRGPVLLARPLLEFDKSALVALCGRLGQAFVSDASNGDPRFARGRLRGLAATLAREGLDRDALLRLGRRARRADEALARAARDLRDAMPGDRSGGKWRVDASALRGAALELVVRALEVEFAELTGGRPRHDSLEALGERVAKALDRHETLAATLGGARLGLAPDGRLTLELEQKRGRDAEAKRKSDGFRRGCSL
jgi:tRNA(Ile)-lysidine synthase